MNGFGTKLALAPRKGSVAVELVSTGSKAALVQAARGALESCVELPGCDLESAGSNACRSALADWVDRTVLSGARCRIVLGGEFFRVDTANLPAMNDQELASSARFEAMDRFGLDEEHAIIQHIALGTDSGRRSVAMLAAPIDRVRRAAQIVLEAGLMPDSIEHAALAAARGVLAWDAASRSALVAMLHVESSVATISIWRDGVLHNLRALVGDWGSAIAAPTHARTDEIALEPIAADTGWRWSAMAEETLRTLRQTCGEASWPSRLLITGCMGEAPDLVRALGGVCAIPTVVVDCADWSLGSSDATGPGWATLLGTVAAEEAAVAARRVA